MRLLTILCVVFLFSGLAAAQEIVIVGHTSNGAASYSVYSVPLVVTPSVTLGSVSPSPAGASNATFGNVAGASNATLSIVSPPPVGVYTRPVWYDPSVVGLPTSAGQEMPSQGRNAHGSGFGASFLSEGAARLMASWGPAKKATRTYSNQDVERMNQNNGTVKYDDKTEHIN